jgi:hypothetical protein
MLHGSFNIRKENRDLLVFAFQGVAAGQNFVSQVFGGVGADGFITPVDGAGRLAAMVAEFGIRGDCGSLFVNRIFFSG